MSHRPMSPIKKKPGADGGKAVSRAELEVLRQKATELASQQPQKAATILTEWVHKGQSQPKPRKKTG